MLVRLAALPALLLGCAILLGCQRAGRYPAPDAAKAPPREVKAEAAPPHWSWHLREGWRAPPDMPIVFVAHGHKDWEGLRDGWNDFPPPAAGTRTIHLGQSPLGAAAAVAVTDYLQVVKIKVPLGLPDPASHVPPANPLTFAKWKLGRQIFFERKLGAGGDTYACASCHQPDAGFADERSRPLRGTRNTLSLINVAYNRRQFWDGRAVALEEVVVQSVDDELNAGNKQPAHLPQETHRWGGLVKALSADIDYRLRFKQVFDLEQPTQDAIAKALATYLRTILSGNSLYDRAEQERRRLKVPELLAEHFAPLLDERLVAALGFGKETKEDIAKKLQRGHRLFHAKGCVACHAGPLFTDYDYHNVGIGEDGERYRPAGAETGRFVHVPIGLKEPRLIGAFRTPTLRALPRTAPYVHDGSYPDLLTVVKYFNHSVHGFPAYLAAPLVDADGRARKLDMSFEDEAALVTFLRSLDGEPVAGMAASPK